MGSVSLSFEYGKDASGASGSDMRADDNDPIPPALVICVLRENAIIQSI
ncbi:MAG: hypothetical protein II871_00435 [Clostridia bacterium]|nr:hypothetical protein [Clostridia bacterium]